MITNAIKRGLVHLHKNQQADGSFLSHSSPVIDDFSQALTLRPTFPTSLILCCLSSLKDTPTLNTIQQKGSDFLLSQKSDFWSFNYWAKNSEEAKRMPYPDDLDDTFCALAALLRTKPQLFDGTTLACLVTMLTSLEIKEGGPYRTWFVDEKAPDNWKDIDLAVNSNVAYFLALLEIDIPNLTTFTEEAIKQKSFSSPYYHSEFPILYFICRFYKNKHCKNLQKMLLAKKDKNGSWGNPLHTALAVASLLNLGTPPKELKKSIAYLIKNQHKGGWQPYAFYVDPTREGKKHYAGSSMLTTAFCLEALGLYLNALETKKNKATHNKESKQANKLQAKIISNVQEIFSDISNGLGKQAEVTMQRIITNDISKQITLLPYYLTKSMGSQNVPKKILLRLGSANLLGWIAYTIFDDFLDEEGDPKTLSVATIALRECTRLLTESVPEQKNFKPFARTILNTIDKANMWEVNNCRIAIKNNIIDLSDLKLPNFKNYKQLANRSLGHALAPLAVLFSLGYKEKSPPVKHLFTFFTYYIIAKQLLDDAHDFEKDIKKGQVTPVVALLLKKVKEKQTTIDLSSSLSFLHEIFWIEIVLKICEDIFEHTQLARRALKKIAIIQDTSLFENILDSVDASAQKALTERENALTFITSYQT